MFTTYSSNNFGQPMSDRHVRADLARLAAKAGLDKRVHPHGLRHSLAVDLSDTGVPLRADRRPVRPRLHRHHRRVPPTSQPHPAGRRHDRPPLAADPKRVTWYCTRLAGRSSTSREPTSAGDRGGGDIHKDVPCNAAKRVHRLA